MYSIFTIMAQTVPEGRLFALDQQTLIQIAIQLLNAIVLAVILGRLLYKPVKNFMAKRREKIKENIAAADTEMARANELIAEYEAKIDNIQQEAEQIFAEARARAGEREELILHEANAEAQRIKQNALATIELDKERNEMEIRSYIIEMATLMAEKYLIGTIDETEQNELFEQVRSQLEESQWRR
ncbi:MAG: F0F1 ATP synthase subunit B [Saccharofermentanales bacterium]|nr:F0F1 ATP synthase subunit B [Eubacteriales bacterium]MDD3611162.1 F0F1 ATP synthase subunit B [Eubacteriales bacterium]HHU04379.1 F0F1 ATP synthase subunit B [Fastidiosipila sp.]